MRAKHRQRLEAAHIEISAPDCLPRPLKVSEGADNSPDRKLAFEPRQRCTEAEVRAQSEREVAIVRTADVQPIGMLEHGGIAVGRANHWRQELASAYCTAPDLHVNHGSSARCLYRRIEP